MSLDRCMWLPVVLHPNQQTCVKRQCLTICRSFEFLVVICISTPWLMTPHDCELTYAFFVQHVALLFPHFCGQIVYWSCKQELVGKCCHHLSYWRATHSVFQLECCIYFSKITIQKVVYFVSILVTSHLFFAWVFH